MKVKVLVFGQLQDITSKGEFYAEDLADTTALQAYLFEQYPQLQNKTFKIALNQNIVREDSKLSDGDEVALLPPFAGG